MAEIDISVVSLNCNGLGDDAKRVAVFKNLRKKSGIFLLQETHSTSATEQKWIRQWGCKNIYFSHGTSNQNGVVIAITSDYDMTIQNIWKDEHGRFIVLDLVRNGVCYTIGNLYAPTRNHEIEQQDIFKAFTECLENASREHVIIGGIIIYI